MELTKEEIEKVAPGADRINAFVGDGITDIQDPAQRLLVLDEIKRSYDAILAGDFELIAEYGPDGYITPQTIDEFLGK